MIDFHLAAAVVFVGISVAILRVRFAKKDANLSSLPLPPGPKPLPLLGNLLDINPAKPWFTYTDWATKYGDIVYSSLLGQDYIVINSVKVAKALLEQRSSIYSDRLSSPLYELFGIDFSTAALGYNNVWKLHRKLFHLTLRAETSTKYQELYTRTAQKLVLSLIDEYKGTADEMKRHLINFSGAIIMAVTYGYEVTTDHDPILGRVRQLMTILELELPAERAVLMTVFPLLSRLPPWVPGLGFKRKAAESRQLLHDVKNMPFTYVKKQMAAGTASNSMVSDFFLSQEDVIDPHLEDTMKDTAATMFLGGTDTTSSALYMFILAMILYPDVQQRAQAEIDTLLGSNTIPEFEHRDSLPFVEAVVRETLRWHPVIPLGLPHVSTADDTYNGYYIPKGAVMVYNVWNMSHNTSNFDDPARFNPDRHFRSDGKLSPDDAVPNSPSFGFGRRLCPGRFFADASIWAAIVTMLATLHFSKAIDVDGHEVEVKPEFTTGLMIHPVPFRCSITSRCSAREKEIRTALKPL